MKHWQPWAAAPSTWPKHGDHSNRALWPRSHALVLLVLYTSLKSSPKACAETEKSETSGTSENKLTPYTALHRSTRAPATSPSARKAREWNTSAMTEPKLQKIFQKYLTHQVPDCMQTLERAEGASRE